MAVHPVLVYLRWHEWQWVPQSRLMCDLNVSPEDLARFMDRYCQLDLIEVSGSGAACRYRYIGNRSSEKRRVTEYLKRIYPRYASAAEIQSAANVYHASQWISVYADVFPIESAQIDGVRKYRYIPDDPRSLLEPVAGAECRLPDPLRVDFSGGV